LIAPLVLSVPGMSLHPFPLDCVPAGS
jgi:hypothetical protein